MKITLIILTLVLLFVTGLGTIYYIKKTEYNKIVSAYDWEINTNSLSEKLSIYFTNNGYFPDSLVQIDTIYRYGADVTKKMYPEANFGRDILSGQDYYYYYLPIYNRTSGKAESYYLLSRAIDGAIDHKPTSGGMLYEDVVGAMSFYKMDSGNYNMSDFFFGKKDVIISKASMDDYYNFKGYQADMTKVFRRCGDEAIERFKVIPLTIEGKVASYNAKSLQAIIHKNDTLTLVCNVYHKEQDVFQKAVGSQIKIKGILDKCDVSSLRAEFKLCVIDRLQ